MFSLLRTALHSRQIEDENHENSRFWFTGGSAADRHRGLRAAAAAGSAATAAGYDASAATTAADGNAGAAAGAGSGPPLRARPALCAGTPDPVGSLGPRPLRAEPLSLGAAVTE